MEVDNWHGFDRRQSESPYTGEDRRRPKPSGYRDNGIPGSNAEEPRNERDEQELARKPGPNPRIPK